MSFSRILAGDHNRVVQTCGTLYGIAAGLLADRKLNDDEIRFLNRWLKESVDVIDCWPGDILHARVKAVLADGIITEEERAHLVETLTQLCGGSLERLGQQGGAVNQLAFDEPTDIRYPGANFCVTGDFVFGPRARVVETISGRGGTVLGGVTKKLDYLIVGLQGSDEWKHGSYGTKIEKAISYKRDGLSLHIVREDVWSAGLRA